MNSIPRPISPESVTFSRLLLALNDHTLSKMLPSQCGLQSPRIEWSSLGYWTGQAGGHLTGLLVPSEYFLFNWFSVLGYQMRFTETKTQVYDSVCSGLR